MPDLKLARLPDRTPIKLSVRVNPQLHRMLKDYTEIYRQQYGHKESIEALIPYMLEAFLAADRGFMKASKELKSSPSKSSQTNQPQE